MTAPSKQTRKWRITLFIVGAVAVLGLLISSSRQAPNRPPLPSPNGYDDFIKAGQLAAGYTGDYRKMSAAELRLVVTQNSEALRFVRAGLSRECRVPIASSQEEETSHISTWVR